MPTIGLKFGTSLPAVQQIPTRAQAWERAIGAPWENEVARFDGETVAFHDVVVSPRVAQRPRPCIWVGGNSRAAVRRAARHGDGWIPWELTPESCAAALTFARRERAAAAR